jgi:copper chaperone NosL
MQARLVREGRFLDRTIDGRARLMVLVATLLLAATYVLPLWNLTMFAPQYPDGLRLDIYSYTLVGGNNGQDIKEINVLNHYIGMRDLVNEEFTEFQWMPFVIGALGLLMLRAVVHATVAALVDVTMLFVYFGAFSLWSFGYKLYRYGHDLSPTAAVQVPPFMPPMFGGQQIANFEVYSYPRPASYAMAGTIVLLLAALAWTWWQARRAAPRDAIAGPAAS